MFTLPARPFPIGGALLALIACSGSDNDTASDDSDAGAPDGDCASPRA